MDPAVIADIFSALDDGAIRRLFGGQGVYHGGPILAIVARDEPLLEADAASDPAFAAAVATQ